MCFGKEWGSYLCLLFGVAFQRPDVKLMSQSGPKSVKTALQREKSEWVENGWFMIQNKKCDCPYLTKRKYK